MAIERGLYELPEGMDEAVEVETVVEMDVMSDGPVVVELEDGSVEITFGEEAGDVDSAPFDANLAEYLDDQDLTKIANDLVGSVETDVNSRKEWADTFVKGLETIGMKMEQRSSPWEDACGVYSTVLAEAAIRFQAEAMSETFPAAGPVKTKVLGEINQDKEDAALRVRTDMNYELTEVMT